MAWDVFSFPVIGQVSAIVERFRVKPTSSDSIYRTGFRDYVNLR